MLLSTANVAVPPPSLNPAILVNGDLNIGGNITVSGLAGSVHANGDLAVDGASADGISMNATASGDFTAKSKNFDAGGAEGGGYASISCSGHPCVGLFAPGRFHPSRRRRDHDPGRWRIACGAACDQWTFSGGKWSITGNQANDGHILCGRFGEHLGQSREHQ